MKTTIHTPGVTCSGCQEAIEGAVRALPGVTAVKVDLARKLVEIDHGSSVTPEALLGAVSQAGYDGEIPGTNLKAHGTSQHASGVLDPVCGMTIDPARAKGTSQYQGQTYYFCSSRCKAGFDGDPVRFLAK